MTWSSVCLKTIFPAALSRRCGGQGETPPRGLGRWSDTEPRRWPGFGGRGGPFSAVGGGNAVPAAIGCEREGRGLGRGRRRDHVRLLTGAGPMQEALREGRPSSWARGSPAHQAPTPPSRAQCPPPAPVSPALRTAAKGSLCVSQVSLQGPERSPSRQMPRWYHCPHQPPSDAQLLPRKKDLVTKEGREKTRFLEAAHLGARVIFLIQGNICSLQAADPGQGDRPAGEEAGEPRRSPEFLS